MHNIVETIQKLTNIPSPTGYTTEIIDFIAADLRGIGTEAREES